MADGHRLVLFVSVSVGASILNLRACCLSACVRDGAMEDAGRLGKEGRNAQGRKGVTGVVEKIRQHTRAVRGSIGTHVVRGRRWKR